MYLLPASIHYLGHGYRTIRAYLAVNVQCDAGASMVWRVVDGVQVVLGEYERNSRRDKSAVALIATSPRNAQRMYEALVRAAARKPCANHSVVGLLPAHTSVLDESRPLRQLSLWEWGNA